MDKDIARNNAPTLIAIEELLEDAYKNTPAFSRTGVLGWNGSHQIAVLTLIHEAERQSVWLMPHDLVVARIVQALGQLNRMNPAVVNGTGFTGPLILKIKLAETQSERMTRSRLLLSEFLGEQYGVQDANTAQLYDLYNKVFWLLNISLVPVAALIGLGYSLVLVAGAIGGILSRVAG